MGRPGRRRRVALVTRALASAPVGPYQLQAAIAAVHDEAARFEDALDGFDHDAFAKRHPTVVAAITDYFQPGRTVDDLFRDSLELILG
jgi:hypothetical protein